jgi:phage baseplate assembly protein W
MATRISRAFKDISLSFAKHPVTNDILVIKNEDAIKKSVTNLVRTILGERFFRPLIGTSVTSNLFELADEEVSIIMKEEIMTVLKNYEPRIVLRNIQARSLEDDNQINVEIEYDIVGLGFPTQNIEFLLLPTRI